MALDETGDAGRVREGSPPESRHDRGEFLKRAGTTTAVLAGSGAFAGLAGRADAARYGRNQRGKIGGEVSIRYWGVGPERVAWSKRIAYFKSRYPNVKVNEQLLTKNGYEEFPALLTQIAAGNPPDVMRVLNFQPTQLVTQGNALLPLDSFISGDRSFDRSDFVPVAYQGGKVNGKQYAIPQNGEPYCLFYNKDAFKKAGLKDPWQQYRAGTWNQTSFLNAAKALKEGGFRYGAAFENWNYDVFVFMGGGRVLDQSGRVVIDRQPAPRALQFLADMIDEGLSPSPEVGGGTYLQFFQNKQLGMYLSGAWWAKYMPKVDFAWTAAPLPRFFGGIGTKLEIDSLSISRGSKNPEAAWAMVKTLTDRRGEELWTAIATPTRRSVLGSRVFRSNPHVPAVVEMLKYSHVTPFTKAGAAVDTAAISAFAPLWLGKKSAAEATKDAAAKIRKAIGG